MANESEHMFSTDRPIDKREEDQLDRAKFAESIATAISHWREKDSLVVGLYGPWGCGKSSVINMTVDALGDLNDKGPLIVKFNPWQVSGQGEIVAAFFQEVRSALPQADDGSLKFLQAFDKYATVVSLVGPSAILAASTGLIDPETATALTTGAAIAGKSPGLFRRFRRKPESFRQSLSKMKDTLKGYMKDLKRPILVVIDDIDRLTTDEIRLVFRLVKANADFPKVIYLLALQPDVVARALDESDANEALGEEYMAKVIQVPFSIPAIDRTKLGNAFLNGTLSAFRSQELWADDSRKNRFISLWREGLAEYFLTLRDVKRFVSMLHFQVGLFRNPDLLEVNPIDLIALEVLRTFEPSVYGQLFAEKSILLKAPDELFGNSPEKVQDRLQRLIERASKARRESVQKIVEDLFPVTQSTLSNTSWGAEYSERWLKDLRVCHDRFFDSYFLMNIPQTEFGQASMERLLAMSHDAVALETELREQFNNDMLQKVTQSIGANLDRIGLDSIVPLAKALFAVGEDVCGDDEEQSGLFSFPLVWDLSYLAEQLFRHIPDESERRVALVTAIETSNYLYVPAILLNRETLRRSESDHGERLFDKDEDLTILTDAWTARLRSLAEANNLSEADGLGFILGRWKDWGSLADAKVWTERAIDTESSVLSLLRGFLHSVRITDSSGAKIRYYMRLEEIEDFVAIKQLKPKVDAMDTESLSDIHRIAIETFLEAVRRRGDDDHYDEWSRGDYPRW